MASTKPTDIPTWNTGGLNRTTPNPTKQALGWELDEEPASSFFNWMGYYTGAYLEWLDERVDDGLKGGAGDEEDLYIHPPTAASGAGGALSLSGGDAVSAGVGGDVLVTAGDGWGNGDGGVASVAGGDGGYTSGDGGAASITGGAGGTSGGGGGAVSALGGDGTGTGAQAGGSAFLRGGDGADTGVGGDADVLGGTGGSGGADGGDASVRGGSAVGTDTDGGDVIVGGGNARGDGGSSVFVLAADGSQGAGTSSRTAVPYIECDGPNRRVELKRPPVIEPGAAPTVGVTAGMLYADSTSGKPNVYDGTGWNRLVPQAYADSDVVGVDTVVATSLTPFAKGCTIPAGILTVGSTVRIVAAGTKTGSNGTLNMRAYIGAATTASADSILATPGDFFIDAEAVISALGASAGRISLAGLITTELGEMKPFAYATNIAFDTTIALGVSIEAQMTSGDTADLFLLRVDVT